MKADVYRVIDLFAAANPSSGRPETNLLIAWRGLTEEQKLARPLVDLPPNDMKLALLGRLECALAPDSYLARNIIVNEFGLNWSNVPRIWLYDLDSAGGINYVVTREYLEYALQHPIRTIESFNGRTEAQNKSVVCPRPAQYEDVDCLAYMLSNDSVTALPKCRLRRDDADEPIGKCQHRKD
jgi:hypothetical protein